AASALARSCLCFEADQTCTGASSAKKSAGARSDVPSTQSAVARAAKTARSWWKRISEVQAQLRAETKAVERRRTSFFLSSQKSEPEGARCIGRSTMAGFPGQIHA